MNDIFFFFFFLMNRLLLKLYLYKKRNSLRLKLFTKQAPEISVVAWLIFCSTYILMFFSRWKTGL